MISLHELLFATSFQYIACQVSDSNTSLKPASKKALEQRGKLTEKEEIKRGWVGVKHGPLVAAF